MISTLFPFKWLVSHSQQHFGYEHETQHLTGVLRISDVGSLIPYQKNHYYGFPRVSGLEHAPHMMLRGPW